MKIRIATAADISGISTLLQDLVRAGKRTRPSDEMFVRDNYVSNPCGIQTVIAEDEGELLGFQCLSRAVEGNPFGVEPGWGIIGTHVAPTAARRGVGRALFAETQKAALAADLQVIDASIVSTNAEGLAYYESIGFRAYRTFEGRICKAYWLNKSTP